MVGPTWGQIVASTLPLLGVDPRNPRNRGLQVRILSGVVSFAERTCGSVRRTDLLRPSVRWTEGPNKAETGSGVIILAAEMNGQAVWLSEPYCSVSATIGDADSQRRPSGLLETTVPDGHRPGNLIGTTAGRSLSCRTDFIKSVLPSSQKSKWPSSSRGLFSSCAVVHYS